MVIDAIDGYRTTLLFFFFFFKQKTAYEIYQCDWSSDVCSSDLISLISPAGLDGFGVAVANAGDVNGDGYADLIIGEIGRASCRERV